MAGERWRGLVMETAKMLAVLLFLLMAPSACVAVLGIQHDTHAMCVHSGACAK